MSHLLYTIYDNLFNETQQSRVFIKPDKLHDVQIAIIQPGCWGDNINSTIMLNPIKSKYPNSQIDIYTTEPYKSAFYYNPFVDKIIAVNQVGKDPCLNYMHTYQELLSTSDYDLILNGNPLFNPNGWNCKHEELGTNLILSWVNTLEKNDIDYELPLCSIMRLTADEKAKADEYLSNTASTGNPIVLMEVEGESGQSFWNHTWTSAICHRLVTKYTATIYVSKKHCTGEISDLLRSHGSNIKFVGDLSIRECAQIFNHADCFFSVSSGLSNACNTNWCKTDIKWIEVVNSPACSSAPIRSEGKTFWYRNDLAEFIDKIVDQLF